MTNEFAKHLDWLVTLWRKAAFRAHAELRARELEALSPDLYGGMVQALEARALELRAGASASRSAPATDSTPASTGGPGPGA